MIGIGSGASGVEQGRSNVSMGAKIAAVVLMTMASAAQAGTAHRAVFGTLPDGRTVAGVTLSNAHGVSATVIAYGATLQSVVVPDRRGKRADVALGHKALAGYLAKREFFGATVGRFANRIAGGRFAVDGHRYQVPANNGPNALHGGPEGLDQKLWEVVDVKSGAAPSVTLRCVSPDGDQGFPGTLTLTATYTLDDHDALTVEYRATTDKPTIVNITNHAYWNLAGDGAARGAMGHVLTIPAERYTPVDATLIPTGEKRSVAGTVFDFRNARAIGDRVRDAADEQIGFGRGYDHNYIVTDAVTATPHLMARVAEPVSGRTMEVWSTQPGVQFYSGNFLDATTIGKSGRLYREGDAIALEPQVFPDAPNQPGFPSARLAPGETYRNVIVFKFGVVGATK